MLLLNPMDLRLRRYSAPLMPSEARSSRIRRSRLGLLLRGSSHRLMRVRTLKMRSKSINLMMGTVLIFEGIKTDIYKPKRENQEL
jgi:hypothetical protein